MLEYVFPNTEQRCIIIIFLLSIPLWNNLIAIGDVMHSVHYNLYSRCPKRIAWLLILFPGKQFDYRVPLFAFISQCFLLISTIALFVLDFLHISCPDDVMADLPQWILYYNLFIGVLSVIDSFVYDRLHKNDIY